MTLPGGIQHGDVFTIFDYEFADGATASSKYFVVMGIYKGQLAGFVTTSKEKGGRQRKDGCSPASGFLPWSFYKKTSKKPFHEGTWLLMRVEWHEARSLTDKIAAGRAVHVYTFADNEIRAFRNCFESSPDWAPVCAQYMYGGKNDTQPASDNSR